MKTVTKLAFLVLAISSSVTHGLAQATVAVPKLIGQGLERIPNSLKVNVISGPTGVIFADTVQVPGRTGCYSRFYSIVIVKTNPVAGTIVPINSTIQVWTDKKAEKLDLRAPGAPCGCNHGHCAYL
jgi:hypothetical protein